MGYSHSVDCKTGIEVKDKKKDFSGAHPASEPRCSPSKKNPVGDLQQWRTGDRIKVLTSLRELNCKSHASLHGLAGSKARAGRVSGSSWQETLRTVVLFFFFQCMHVVFL